MCIRVRYERLGSKVQDVPDYVINKPRRQINRNSKEKKNEKVKPLGCRTINV